MQDLSLPMCIEDHRQGAERPDSFSLDHHRIRCSQPFGSSHPIPGSVPTNERNLESRSAREMFLATCYLPSWLHRVRSRRIYGFGMRRYPNLHIAPDSIEHQNQSCSLYAHGPWFSHGGLRHSKSNHTSRCLSDGLHLGSVETGSLHHHRTSGGHHPGLTAST